MIFEVKCEEEQRTKNKEQRTKNEELTDRTHTRIVSFIVLDGL